MNTPKTDPLAVSRQRAAAELGVSTDTIDRLVARGVLDQIKVSERKVSIRWKSLLKLIGEDA
jgi:orotate phosphoribosyltransferase-like protein